MVAIPRAAIAAHWNQDRSSGDEEKSNFEL